MNLFDAFDRIYLINLPERKDRLSAALRELKCVGIEQNDARLHIFAGIRPDGAGTFPSRGARGCYLSHLAVLSEALRADVERVLILEDDLAFSPAAAQEQTDLAQRLLQPDWAFAYPGHVEPLAAGMDGKAQWQETARPLVCAHFYAVQRHTLRALIEYLSDCMHRLPGDPVGGPMHIDGAYSMFRAARPRLVTLIAAPSLGYQRSSRSDIYPNRWYDRITVVREVVGWLRAWRNQRRSSSRISHGV